MEKDLKDLLIDELHDLLSAEEQIVVALPDMVKAADSAELKEAFTLHLKETKGQVQRLTKVFSLLKVKRKAKLCKAMKGLIEECKEVLKCLKTKSPLRDAALISKAQRIEHYEIAAYGTVRTFAKDINQKEVAALLQATLNEEANADKTLTKIADGRLWKSGVNQKAIDPKANKPKAATKKAASVKKPASAALKKKGSTLVKKVVSGLKKAVSAAPKKKSAAAPKKKSAAAPKKKSAVVKKKVGSVKKPASAAPKKKSSAVVKKKVSSVKKPTSAAPKHKLAAAKK